MSQNVEVNVLLLEVEYITLFVSGLLAVIMVNVNSFMLHANIKSSSVCINIMVVAGIIMVMAGSAIMYPIFY